MSYFFSKISLLLPKVRCASLCISGLVALSIMPLANASEPPEAVNLKTCVAQAIEQERLKTEPNADNVTAACSAELNIYLGILPTGIQSEAKHQLKHEVEDMLQ